MIRGLNDIGTSSGTCMGNNIELIKAGATLPTCMGAAEISLQIGETLVHGFLLDMTHS